MSKEKRLIDANALEIATFIIAQESEYARGWNDALYAAMINAPTIDAVEVVRCKDCKHLMFSDCYGECGQGYMGIVNHDDFCNHGERRKDE